MRPVIENVLSSTSSSEEDEDDAEEEEEEEDERDFALKLVRLEESGEDGEKGGGDSNQVRARKTKAEAKETDRVRRKREAFTLQQKLEVLRFLGTHSVNATSREFKVDPKSVRLWRSQKERIEQAVQEELMSLQESGELQSQRKRISGAGRKKREKVIVEIEENPNKRHRRTIKLSDKVEIIRLISNGQTQSDVARSLGISQSTVQTIWSSKSDILERNENPKGRRRNLRWKKYSRIDEALLSWVKGCREANNPPIQLDMQILQDKAVELAEYFKQPDFKGQVSNWVKVFKRKHGLTWVWDLDRVDRSLGDGGVITFTEPAIATVSTHQMLEENPEATPNLTNQNQTQQSIQDLVPEFDLSSFPSLSYPQTGQGSSIPPVMPTSTGADYVSFNPHLPLIVPGTGSVTTTCDAMRYLELIRSWVSSTFGEKEEALNNHLNAIENAVLKRRMTEMTGDQLTTTASISLNDR